MPKLKMLARQFEDFIQDPDEFADLVGDFDELVRLYSGVGETPPSVALGLGLRAGRHGGPLKPAIIMYVPRDSLDGLALPERTSRGFPIHVEAIGPIWVEPPVQPPLEVEANEAFRAPYAKPPGGVSIATLGDPYSGTLGCYLVNSGETYLLSNRHVLDPGITGKTGLKVQQQSAEDGNKTKAGIADTTYLAALDPSHNNLADAAVARLTSAEFDPRMLVGDGPDFKALKSPATVVRAGETVMKSGRTSGRTQSEVDSIWAVVPVPFPDGKTYAFVDCIAVKQVPKPHSPVFQQGGDSGALLVIPGGVSDAGQPVGLLFAASSVVAFALPIANVLTALKTASGKQTDFSIVF